MTSRHTLPDLIIGKHVLFWRILGYSIQLIDIWVEDSIYKAYAWAFVRVLVGQLYVNFPQTAFEWS